MIDTTTTASHNDAPAADATLLTDDELTAVSGGGVWSSLLSLLFIQRDCP